MMNTTAAAAAQLTDLGTAFMTLVGKGKFDFFDDGIVAESGNYGDNMAWQAAEKLGVSRHVIAGVMSGLASLDIPLWEIEDVTDLPQATTWWKLTEVGAAVANSLV